MYYYYKLTSMLLSYIVFCRLDGGNDGWLEIENVYIVLGWHFLEIVRMLLQWKMYVILLVDRVGTKFYLSILTLLYCIYMI